MKNLVLICSVCLATVMTGCQSEEPDDRFPQVDKGIPSGTASNGQSGQEGVSFHYNFNAGDVFTETRRTTQTIKTPDGQELIINADVFLDWKVLEASGTGYTIQITGQRYEIRARDGDGEVDVEYDSEEGGSIDNPFISGTLKPRMDAWKATEMTVTMTRQGKLTDVQLGEKFEKMLADDPIMQAGVPSDAGGQQGIGFPFFELPEQEIVAGDEWDQVYEWKPNPERDRVAEISNVVQYKGTEEVDGRELHRFEYDAMVFLKQDADEVSGAPDPIATWSRVILIDQEAGKLFRTIMIEVIDLGGTQVHSEHVTTVE